MTKLVLNDEVASLIREKAEQRGYDDPTAYLLDLLAADSEKNDKQFAANHAIRESFKQAFKQALQGKGMSREEFERKLSIL
jgi:ribosome-binding protein aMBF1 (putative translation factor)